MDRVARSSSSPARSRAAASWAAGWSRSRTRRSGDELAARGRRRDADRGAGDPVRRPPEGRANSARSGTTSSAAADGVGARTSAAKSASVTSTS